MSNMLACRLLCQSLQLFLEIPVRLIVVKMVPLENPHDDMVVYMKRKVFYCTC